jgi:hypothetical protein
VKRLRYLAKRSSAQKRNHRHELRSARNAAG